MLYKWKKKWINFYFIANNDENEKRKEKDNDVDNISSKYKYHKMYILKAKCECWNVLPTKIKLNYILKIHCLIIVISVENYGMHIFNLFYISYFSNDG